MIKYGLGGYETQEKQRLPTGGRRIQTWGVVKVGVKNGVSHILHFY
jgi:hypothetical protein